MAVYVLYTALSSVDRTTLVYLSSVDRTIPWCGDMYLSSVDRVTLVWGHVDHATLVWGHVPL